MCSRITTDEYFIKMAELVAERSSCLSRKVGCVLVSKDNIVLSTGYNGPPRGQEHCKECIRKKTNNLHLCRAIHAEQNALLFCPDINKIEKAYITYSPCNSCMKLFLNTSCKEIIYLEDYKENDFIFKQYNLNLIIIRKFEK